MKVRPIELDQTFAKKDLTFGLKCGMILVSGWKSALRALPLGNVLVSSHS